MSVGVIMAQKSRVKHVSVARLMGSLSLNRDP
jgi:hypothetical protein